MLALRKPNILVPLSKNASRGDQILNARSFEKQGFSAVLEEEDVTDESLLNKILELYENRFQYITQMNQSSQTDSASVIVDMIKKCAGL